MARAVNAARAAIQHNKFNFICDGKVFVARTVRGGISRQFNMYEWKTEAAERLGMNFCSFSRAAVAFATIKPEIEREKNAWK